MTLNVDQIFVAVTRQAAVIAEARAVEEISFVCGCRTLICTSSIPSIVMTTLTTLTKEHLLVGLGSMARRVTKAHAQPLLRDILPAGVTDTAGLRVHTNHKAEAGITRRHSALRNHTPLDLTQDHLHQYVLVVETIEGKAAHHVVALADTVSSVLYDLV
jgi:hypothetical protein